MGFMNKTRDGKPKNHLTIKIKEMKRYKILNLLIGILLLTFSACEPIVNRDTLQNSFNPDDIKLEVIQSTPGGNGLSLRMTTPGVTGYWDYNIDTKFSDRVDVSYPIPGKSTFTFHVTTAYMPNNNPAEVEYITKSIDVQIDKLDQPLPDAYYALVGENLEGKTWVFDGGPAPDGRMWWYMSPPGDPGAWETAWWNAAGTCCPPADAAGKMVFDLDGAANYTYYSGPEASGVVGSFSFNSDFSKLSISGDQKILGNEEPRGNPDGQYIIVSLTADKMILYVPSNAGGTGWTWIFKPE